jgi:ribosomal protein S12 methylthiotransferase accessory factor
VGEGGNLGVVVTGDYLDQGLRAYNQEALSLGRPWMLIKPVGGQILVGPVFQPHRTGCWECLAQRLRINRAVETFVQRKQGRDDLFPIPAAETTATRELAYGIAATEIAKWIAREEPLHSEGHVLSVDIRSWRFQTHVLTRQPHCRACGEPRSALKACVEPVVLGSGRKTFTEDGGHRVVGPAETLQRYERHVSPVTGAVSALYRPAMAGDGVMHVYVAGDNHARPHFHLKHLQKSLRGKSSGKGTTDLQARASGLCEALERYSGVFQGTEPRRQATMSALEGLAIHPNDCMLFSERQFEQREVVNARGSQFNYVPVPFDPSMEIDWTPVWSLTHESPRYLPTAYCYHAYPFPENDFYCVACSNGNAAGNTMEEAILQGFLELVERDSVGLWWYNRVRRPAVDLGSFDVPYLTRLETFLRDHGRDLWVLDLTSDLDTPVFAAMSRRPDQRQERIMLGFGAHLDPRIALLRAVTELVQSLAWILDAEKDGSKTSRAFEDPDVEGWLKTATVANQPYLAPDESVPATSADSFPRRWADDLREDVLLCQRLVERHGMEMLVLNQTRPDIGLPVVKVIVPGLRHFWARFAPGRLYDAPVKLGWLPEPLTEEQLNPVPMFL